MTHQFPTAEREQFEAWLEKFDGACPCAHCWDAWQAARRTPPAEAPAEAREAVAEVYEDKTSARRDRFARSVRWLTVHDPDLPIGTKLYTHPATAGAEWVSVETLPEQGIPVIVLFYPYDNHENERIVTKAQHYDGVFYDHDGSRMHPPTHWMPLLTPPKEASNG